MRELVSKLTLCSFSIRIQIFILMHIYSICTSYTLTCYMPIIHSVGTVCFKSKSTPLQQLNPSDMQRQHFRRFQARNRRNSPGSPPPQRPPLTPRSSLPSKKPLHPRLLRWRVPRLHPRDPPQTLERKR